MREPRRSSARRRLALHGTSPLVSTFHSFCVRLLRRDGDALGRDPPWLHAAIHHLRRRRSDRRCIKSIYKQLGLDDKIHAVSRGAVAHQPCEEPQANAAGHGYKQPTDPKLTRLARSSSATRTGCAQANALDFDDLLLEAVRLLATTTDLRERYNRRFEFLMIDEYQDTNRSQYELMRLLTAERTRTSCVVGDEDQSIYGWRGADIRNILDFERDYPDARSSAWSRTTARRRTFSKPPARWSRTITSAKANGCGPIPARATKISLYEAPDAENEALFIADTIEKHAGAQSERSRGGAVSHQLPIAPD